MSVTFSGGGVTINGGGWTLTPPPPTAATAGWFGGGYVPGSPSGTNYSIIDRITFATDTGTATVRGPLSSNRQRLAGAGTFDYGWFGGGLTAPAGPSTVYSTVDRVTYATDSATASIRGPLASSRYYLAASSDNTTYGWYGAGDIFSGGGVAVSNVERITYASDTATATSRGPLSLARYALAASSNANYGWFGGGVPVSTVDRITYATDSATASVRGPLDSARWSLFATGNDNYGWFAGGSAGTTVARIDYANDTATASVRGPLSVIRNSGGAAGNSTDGWFAGGLNYPTTYSSVDRITYATDTATATVRGNLSQGRTLLGATSGVQ